jgi:hypothetical protein
MAVYKDGEEMTEKTTEEKGGEPQKFYTKAEIEAFVAEIGRKVVDSNPAYLHSMLALNHLLRQPNLKDLLDSELKEQLKDIWLKLKTTGLQVQDPPILFGIPDNAINYEAGNVETGEVSEKEQETDSGRSTAPLIESASR